MAGRMCYLVVVQCENNIQRMRVKCAFGRLTMTGWLVRWERKDPMLEYYRVTCLFLLSMSPLFLAWYGLMLFSFRLVQVAILKVASRSWTTHSISSVSSAELYRCLKLFLFRSSFLWLNYAGLLLKIKSIQYTDVHSNSAYVYIVEYPIKIPQNPVKSSFSVAGRAIHWGRNSARWVRRTLRRSLKGASKLGKVLEKGWKMASKWLSTQWCLEFT